MCTQRSLCKRPFYVVFGTRLAWALQFTIKTAGDVPSAMAIEHLHTIYHFGMMPFGRGVSSNFHVKV